MIYYKRNTLECLNQLQRWIQQEHDKTNNQNKTTRQVELNYSITKLMDLVLCKALTNPFVALTVLSWRADYFIIKNHNQHMTVLSNHSMYDLVERVS